MDDAAAVNHDTDVARVAGFTPGTVSDNGVVRVPGPGQAAVVAGGGVDCGDIPAACVPAAELCLPGRVGPDLEFADGVFLVGAAIAGEDIPLVLDPGA